MIMAAGDPAFSSDGRPLSENAEKMLETCINPQTWAEDELRPTTPLLKMSPKARQEPLRMQRLL